MHMVPCVFQLSFVDLGPFWGHPSTIREDKGLNDSLVVLMLLFFFMLSVDASKGFIRIRL